MPNSFLSHPDVLMHGRSKVEFNLYEGTDVHHTPPSKRHVAVNMTRANLALSLGLPVYHLVHLLLSALGLDEPAWKWNTSLATYVLNAALHWWLPSLLLFLAIRQCTGSWLQVSRFANALLLLSNLTLVAFLLVLTVHHLLAAGPAYGLAGPFQRVWLLLAGAGWWLLVSPKITQLVQPGAFSASGR